MRFTVGKWLQTQFVMLSIPPNESSRTMLGFGVFIFVLKARRDGIKNP